MRWYTHTLDESEKMEKTIIYHDYIVIGAGPAGTQMGYFLETAGRDYLILESGHQCGMFFSHKPRHRRLNSFNKRFNWYPEPEFNLRFDWNSLLTHDYSFPFRGSKDLYPLADTVVRYMNEFREHFGIKVQFNTKATYIDRDPETKHFIITASDGNEYRCKVLLMASGPVKPVIPDIPGIEYAEGYESHDTNLERYENKRVFIIGHGNSAFETANHLANAACIVTISVGNKKLKHAWQTHYVGDVRAAGNAILDMSQLKLLHGVAGIVPTKIEKNEDGSLRLYYKEELPHWNTPGKANGWYDVDFVIRCTGWKYIDDELFAPSILPAANDNIGKYPLMSAIWESTTPDLYYLGSPMEGRNRRSPMGFIHGYRYGVRALHRVLESRYEGVPTPTETFPLKNADDLMALGEFMIKRISVSSGLYEAYGIFCDTLVFDTEKGEATLFYELPVDYILAEPFFADKMIMLFTLEYGFNNFPDSDINAFIRRNDPERPGCVAYLHPVFRVYENGVFSKARNTRSSTTIRYDPSADVFEGELGHEKPRNTLLNFINEVTKVTDVNYPEDHFYNNEERGGFTPAEPGEKLSNPGLPQCMLTVGGQQVGDFEHLERVSRRPDGSVPPWIHTL